MSRDFEKELAEIRADLDELRALLPAADEQVLALERSAEDRARVAL